MQQDRWVLLTVAVLVLGIVGYVGYPTLRGLASPGGNNKTGQSQRDADPVQSPSEVVKAFYDALSNERWDDAYGMLSPAYRSAVSEEALEDSYGNFAKLDADIEVSDASVVHVTARTSDRDDQTRLRTFAVTYTLVRVGATWLIDDKRSRVVSDTVSRPSAEPTAQGEASVRESGDAAGPHDEPGTTPDPAKVAIGLVRKHYDRTIGLLFGAYNESQMGSKVSHFNWSAAPASDPLWSVTLEISGDDPIDGTTTFQFLVNPKTSRVEQTSGPDLSFGGNVSN